MTGPVLTTPRLVLRQPAEADLPALVSYGQSPRNRFTGGPQDAFGAWRVLLAGIGHWTLRGYGFFSVDETGTGAFVGRVGVIFHPGWPAPELAWHLFDGHEGKGFATEAAAAARAWYGEAISEVPLISMIHAANAGSQRVAQRLGARLDRTEDHEGEAVGIWVHPAPPAGEAGRPW
jgi:RimJ/RimL family protein N-acetyltransferase